MDYSITRGNIQCSKLTKIITGPQDGLPSKVVRLHKKQLAHTKRYLEIKLSEKVENMILTLLHKNGHISYGPI